MIAVDTNILVYAHRADAPHHTRARDRLMALAVSGRTCAVPWPCIHEFLAVTTNGRLFRTPSLISEAVGAVRAWLNSRDLVLLSEGSGHLDLLAELIESRKVRGPKVHDARIAAICLSHGVSERWTSDRDFAQFPSLRTRNPLTDM